MSTISNTRRCFKKVSFEKKQTSRIFRASWRFSLLFGGGIGYIWGSTLLKIVICIKTRYLEGGLSNFF